MKLHLTKRLSAVANFVSEGAVLADIGSDHAFLPCYLAQNKRIKKAHSNIGSERMIKRIYTDENNVR